jgi:hypothetical protein
MVPGRRRARAAQTQSAVPSLPAGEQAVHDAEAIVGRAWAEQLLRYYDRMDCAFNAAREQYEAACVSLVAAQRARDPSEISVAHAALQSALDACRLSEAARERGREALQRALDALTRASVQDAVSATASRVRGDGPMPTTASAATPGSSIQHQEATSDDVALKAARRALWRFWSLLRARRAPDPGQP